MSTNVLFKKGTQAGFDGIQANGYVPGAFYLTTDTERLYFANTASEAFLLNNQIIHVADIAALNSVTPVKGEVYYATAENVLASWNGSGWTQINKDTNTDSYVSKAEVVKNVDTTNGQINFTLKISQITKNGSQEAAGPAVQDVTFSIATSDIGNIVSATNVGIGAAIADNKATISTEGNGSNAAANITISGDGSVTVGGTADNIVISGVDTKYGLKSSEANIVLSEAGQDKYTVGFEAGTNITVGAGSAANKIAIGHADLSTEKVTSTSAPDYEESFDVVDSLEFHDDGHVKKYNVKTVTLPKRFELGAGSVVADNTGKITVVYKDGSQEIASASGQDLYYTVNGAKVYNQGVLSFYTREETDNLLKGIDAMVYKGTVSGSSDLPAAPAIGDTYVVAVAGTYGGHEAAVGDILIAQGTEVNGAITSGTLKWDHVASGKNTDTTYTLAATNNKLVFTPSTGGQVAIDVVAGNDLALDTAVANKISIKHADITTGSANGTDVAAGYGESFTVIDNITVDNGHITNLGTKKITLPASDNTTYDFSIVNGSGKASISIDANNEADQAIDVVQGTAIVVAGADAKTIKVSHADVAHEHTAPAAATGLNAEGEFTAINALTVNAQGHVTGYTTQKYKLPVDNDHYHNAMGQSVTAANNKATIATSITGQGVNDLGDTISVESSSMEVVANATGDGVVMNLVWGSF